MTQSSSCSCFLSGQLAAASVSEEACYKMCSSAAVSLRYRDEEEEKRREREEHG